MTHASNEDMRILVTTPLRPKPHQVARASEMAPWFGGAVVPRRGQSIAHLLANADAVVVVGDPAVVHVRGVEHPLFFHPSMAHQRLRRIAQGEPDRLLALAGVSPGDVVIDATVGLGTDALVFAAAVGARGRVEGVERSPVLYGLLRAVQVYGSEAHPREAELLRRVLLVHADHADWLRSKPDESADVVYFDPMFREPVPQSAHMQPIRPVAWEAPLSEEVLNEAKRVARKAVIVKERPKSGVFEALGLQPDRTAGRFAYGVWRRPR
ncbi:class I SAM-dependent methyltransferase [Alicyclobacillus sendaiensis]|uniref:Class I SAM-dependent methyltransferase n=1 Tax=Alicyclobacillus sendaiensis PA2 TaxID=3029425 RepID=A0ABT6XVP7_ALISE|nr:class I SAM-dependent methyltransferase [Alicyclobacillus sendaiensis]MDI9259160.1 class I SAM-dependent methyltransferase [Alicyclobacillus sendaiensis PA2]